MIYKKIKDSNYIWNPETTLVFNKNRKVIGRYVDKAILIDSESIKIAKQHNIQIDISLQKFDSNLEMDDDQKQESSQINSSCSTDSLFDSCYDNHPAFKVENINIVPISTPQKSDFIDLLTDEFKNKLNTKVNELVYRIIDLESTLKNLSEDYDQLLIENQQLKKQLQK